MKKIFLFLILLFFLMEASAECALSGMQFFPQQKQISQNSWFMVEGYFMSRPTIESFSDRQVYLEAVSGETVLLELQDMNVGKMSLTQAVFRPVKSLEPNTRYYLRFSDITEREEHELQQYNHETRKREKIYWETSELASSPKLSENFGLNLLDTEVTFYGCGPAAYAVFEVEGSEGNEIWYKTELVDLNNNDSMTFILSETLAELKVGHGMCSGGFTFEEENEYKVRFTAMNTDGDEIEISDWTYFESPYKNAENPWIIN
jgi:hypothetical protein